MSVAANITQIMSPLMLLLIVPWVVGQVNLEKDLESTSGFSRSMASQGAHFTQPENPVVRRRSFPESNPHICLAFLSCCGRTDLLNHTMAAVIRHMEEDEPDHLRYEIAWVDNGSGPHLTSVIEDSYPIDHALPMAQNTGLAYGMNLLIFNLCTAPYILLLEEDWLYLDELIAPQTPQRKNAIATAIALTEQNLTTFDGRRVMGVFLRPETYNSFLQFPLADVWEQATLDLTQLPSAYEDDDDYEEECHDGDQTKMAMTVDYQVFCSDPSVLIGNIW